METVNVNNNINLHYIPMSKFKTTSVSLFIHRPLCKEEVSYNALLPKVLKSGSMEYKTREIIAEKLDNLYGATLGSSVLKVGEDNLMFFDCETISDRYTPNNEKLLSELLNMLMSIIFKPLVFDGAFDKDIVRQEKKEAIDRIEAFINDKRQYAASRCISETARGTDFAISRLGHKDDIEKITPESLYEYYKSVITSSVIDIYICGDANVSDAEKTIKGFISDMIFTEGSIRRTELIDRACESVHEVTEEMDVNQGKLAMGFLTGVKPESNDSYALAVLNSIFGAGAHSKLFNNVREKLSLAYYASSQLERLKGMIIVNAGIEFCNFQKAYDEILIQLEEIQKGNITDYEFESSINTIANSCKSYYDDQRAMAVYNLKEKIADTNTSLEEYLENICKVTKEDVVRVSKNLKLDTVYFLKGRGDGNEN